jgi:hypothetical protein
MDQRIGLLGIGLLAAFPCLGGCFGHNSAGPGSTDDGGSPSFEAGFGDVTAPSSVTISAGGVLDFGLADCGGTGPPRRSPSATAVARPSTTR